MSTPDILLDAKGLAAWYGAAQILYDVDLQVRRGEVVASWAATARASPPPSKP
jgi:branched-chain amino acid transport system ATP-binding protein